MRIQLRGRLPVLKLNAFKAIVVDHMLDPPSSHQVRKRKLSGEPSPAHSLLASLLTCPMKPVFMCSFRRDSDPSKLL